MPASKLLPKFLKGAPAEKFGLDRHDKGFGSGFFWQAGPQDLHNTVEGRAVSLRYYQVSLCAACTGAYIVPWLDRSHICLLNVLHTVSSTCMETALLACQPLPVLMLYPFASFVVALCMS